MREEHAGLSAVLSRLVDDDQGCLIAALTDDSLTQLPPTEVLRSRVLEVPSNASLTGMPAWGLLLDLEAPLGRGVLEIDVVTPVDTIPVRIRSDRVRVGETTTPVYWDGKRILIETRPQGILVRLPGASPLNIALGHSPERNEYAARYTVRGGVGLSRVLLARVPQRQDPLFRTTPGTDQGQ